MRGDLVQASASAAAGVSAISTESAGDTRCDYLAQLFRLSGRGFDARVSTTCEICGVSARIISVTSLSRMAANTSGRESPEPVQVACERFSSSGVVRGIEQRLPSPGSSTRCIRPGQRTLASPATIGSGPSDTPACSSCFEQTDGHNGVVHLMIAGEREPHLAVVAHRSSQRESLGAVGMRLSLADLDAAHRPHQGRVALVGAIGNGASPLRMRRLRPRPVCGA